VARGRCARAARPLLRARAARRQQSRRGLHPRRHGARQGDHRRGVASHRRGSGVNSQGAGGVTISTVSRGFDLTACVQDDIAAALRRRVREIGGMALIGVFFIATAALASWSVKDPSLSYASGGAVHNLLGTGGAIAADLLMQLFGLAAIAIVLPVAFWGWRLFSHRQLDRLRLRLLLWLAGAPLAAGFIACLTRPPTWPLPTGLGGVIGDTLLRLPAWLAGGFLSGPPRPGIPVLVGGAAVIRVAARRGLRVP